MIRVLYFAHLRDLAGCAEESMALPADVTTLGGLRARLAVRLKVSLAGVRLARNEQFASDGEAVRTGDVIALLPPVSGG